MLGFNILNTFLLQKLLVYMYTASSNDLWDIENTQKESLIEKRSLLVIYFYVSSQYS
jgi:hypothetical protein